MNHWTRVRYAFACTSISIGILVIIAIITNADIGEIIFSPVFVVPAIVFFYLIAPLLSKYINYADRDSSS